MVGREIISNAISCLHFLHQKLKALSFRTQTRRNIDLRRVVMFYRPERGANLEWRLASFRLRISGDFGVRFLKLVPIDVERSNSKLGKTH